MNDKAKGLNDPTDGDEELIPRPIEDGSAVLYHDGWDAQEWRKTLAEHPPLSARLEGHEFPTALDLARDLFWSLVKSSPRSEPRVPLTHTHQLNRTLVEQALATREWHHLRSAGTVGEPLLAALGTLGLTEALLKSLPPEIQQQTERLHEMERDLARFLDEAAQEGDPSQAGQLQEQAAQQQQEAATLEEKIGAAAQQLADSLPAHLEGVRQAARRALKEAETAVEEVATMIDTFSNGGDTFGPAQQGMPMAEKLALADQVRRSAKLRQIAAIAGRLKRIAMQKQATRLERHPDEVVGVTTGSDIEQLLPSELLLLADPDLEDLFFARWAEGCLALYEVEGKEREGQGPIILAIDGSGSMSDSLGPVSKEVWAKGIMLALLAIAKKQRRDLAVIHFASAHQLETFHFPRGEGSPSEIVRCADHFFNGETAFEPWMKEALALVQESRYDRADVLVLSDGLSAVEPAVQAEWQRIRRARQLHAYGILLGTHQGARLLAALCDDVITVADLGPQTEQDALHTLFSI